MRIAGYLRVSTLRQAEDGVSIEMQKRIIINHCEMLEIISDESEIKWYIDDGWSAKSLERPAMRSLIGDIKTRQMDLVVAYDMSRVSRDIMDMMSLLKMLDKYGVSLKCLYDNPSFETASERFMTTIKMATHQYERERTSERTRDAIINIAESGRYPFSGMKHYGYMKDDDGRMVLNPEETSVLICRRCGSTLLCKSAYGKMKKMYLYYFCPTCKKRIRQSDVEDELSEFKVDNATKDFKNRYNALRDIETLLLSRRSKLNDKFLEGAVSVENMQIMLTAIENELRDARRKRSAIQSLDAVRVFSDFEDAEQKKAFVEMHIRRIVIDIQEKKVLTIEFKESETSAEKNKKI